MNSNIALIILTILFVIYVVIDRIADKTQQEFIEMQDDLIGLQAGLITEMRQYICMLERDQKDIVKCEDCRRRDDDYVCYKWASADECPHVNPDDFCSYGVKKGADDEEVDVL